MPWLLTCTGVFLLSYLLVPPMIALAWRIGAMDVPLDWRRMHCEKLPRDGGLAVFLAFSVGLCILGHGREEVLALLLGGSLLLLVGLADDIFCLGAWTKLAVQTLASLGTLWLSGAASGAGLILALLWMLLLCNAHNMIDGLDGLLAGCGTIEAVALAVFFSLAGEGERGAGPLLLASALLGFRVWNRFPARIFAGDCGSTVVGFLLGYFSLPAFGMGETVGGISVAPFLLFAYPLTDLFAAVVRRLLRGSNPLSADRGHLHHRLSAAGLTQVQCGGVLLLLTGGAGTVGALLARQSLLIPASLCCLAAVLLLLLLRSYVLDFA